MGQKERLLRNAINNIQIADHLIYMTYPLVRDNKLMIQIANNLYISTLNVVAAILYYEKVYKQIQVLPIDIDSRIDIFENHVVPKYMIKKEVLNSIKELKQIMSAHKTSPIEFSRKDNYLMCSEDYGTIVPINVEILKQHMKNIKELINIASTLK